MRVRFYLLYFFEKCIIHMYVGWLISTVSYRVVSLIVEEKKRLHTRSVVNTV